MIFTSNTGFFSVFPYSWVFTDIDVFFSYFILGTGLARPLSGCVQPYSTWCLQVPYVWQDMAGLGFLALFFYTAWRESSFPSAIKKTALVLAILPIMVLAADYREFFTHVTNVQFYTGILPWFSNFDLLVSCSAIYLTVEAYQRFERRSHGDAREGDS